MLSSHNEVQNNKLQDINPQKPRRSTRVTIDIPVEIIYQGPNDETLVQPARTLSVSLHGAVLVVESGRQLGQNIKVSHKRTREEIACRVVNTRRVPKSTNTEIGVEFSRPMPSLWHIRFPSPS